MKKDIEFESEFERKKAEAERKAKFEKFCATYRNDMSECRRDFVSGYIDIVNYSYECSRRIIDYMNFHEFDEKEWQELENLLCEFLFPNAFEKEGTGSRL